MKAQQIASEIKKLKSQYRETLEQERKQQAAKTARLILLQLANMEGVDEEDKIEALSILLDSYALSVQGLHLL